MDKILIKEVVAPICIIAISFIAYFILSHIIRALFKVKVKSVEDIKRMKLAIIINNFLKYVMIVIAILMILEVFGIDTKAIVTSLGAATLVIGLAFQDILKDFLAGISIILEGQYALGDTVTINGFKGEVVALGLKTTKIKAYTGEIKMVANRLVTEIINHSVSHSLVEVSVNVAYDSDLDKVEKVLTDICDRINRTEKNMKGKLALYGLNNIKATSVEYLLMGKTKPMQHMMIAREIKKEVKQAFDEHQIKIGV